MGIRGLTSFIDNNPQLLESHLLHDVKVVIDGNNLCHCLYYDSRVDYVFGGDYDKFFTRAKKYLSVYRQCGIYPYVIFDGGYDYSDRKLRTTLQRNKDRVSIAHAHSRGRQFTKRLFPILAMDVLRHVLDVMEIAYAQCDFEADDQIVALANHLGCPVLSLDSDFYIFDVTAGFIPLDSIDMSVKQILNNNGSVSFNYLECQIYHAENILSCFDNLDRTILPLFATLLGNDFVDVQTFNTFFAQIKCPKVKCRKLRYAKRHCKMIGLLWWLQNQSVDEAIKQVVSFLKKEKRDQMQLLIERTVQGYTKCNVSLIQSLGLQSNCDGREDETVSLATMHGTVLPQWFALAFFRGHLSPFFLNAVGQQRIMLQAQTEDFECCSSYAVALPIRQAIYGLLSSHMHTSVTQNENEPNTLIAEYDRIEGSFQKVRVVATNCLPAFGRLPSLDDLWTLHHDSRTSIMKEILGVCDLDLNAFPLPWHIFVMVLHYWIKRATPQITEHHMNAALLCFLTLTVFKSAAQTMDLEQNHGTENAQLESQDSFTSYTGSVMSLLKVITPVEATAAIKNLDKYNKKPEFSRVHPFVVSVVHGFSQLQTCLLFSSHLNQLLASPYSPLSVETCFSGTFLHNVCVHLSHRPSPVAYLVELLGRKSACSKLFFACQEVILTATGMEHFRPHESKNNSGRKKRKDHIKKTVPGNVCTAKDDIVSSDSSEVVSPGPRAPLKIHTKVATKNRFQQLAGEEESDSPVEFVVDDDGMDGNISTTE